MNEIIANLEVKSLLSNLNLQQLLVMHNAVAPAITKFKGKKEDAINEVIRVFELSNRSIIDAAIELGFVEDVTIDATQVDESDATTQETIVEATESEESDEESSNGSNGSTAEKSSAARDLIDAKVLALIISHGPCKIGTCRAAWVSEDPEFAARKDKNRKGIMRRSVHRLEEAGKIVKTGPIFTKA